MQILYLRKKEKDFIRKISLDMPFLSSHKMIRMLKKNFEEGLYLLFKEKGTDDIKEYPLDSGKIIKEDDNFYYFKFPFKPVQVENIKIDTPNG